MRVAADFCRDRLIELLVVVAIIAILASMLLPALRAAVDRARCAVCVSNLRQQYMGIAMYANDNQEQMPYRENWQQVHRIDWLQLIARYTLSGVHYNLDHRCGLPVSDPKASTMVWRQGPYVCPVQGQTWNGQYWQGGVGPPHYWINYGIPNNGAIWPYRHNTCVWNSGCSNWDQIVRPTYRWGHPGSNGRAIMMEMFLDNLNVSAEMGIYYQGNWDRTLHVGINNALMGDGSVKGDRVFKENRRWFRTYVRN